MVLYFKKPAFTVVGPTVSFAKLSLPARGGDRVAGGKALTKLQSRFVKLVACVAPNPRVKGLQEGKRVIRFVL